MTTCTVTVNYRSALGDHLDIANFQVSALAVYLGNPIVAPDAINFNVVDGGTFELEQGDKLRIRVTTWGSEWNVEVPAQASIGLDELVLNHSINPTSGLPVPIVPDSMQDLVTQAVDARDDAVAAKTAVEAVVATTDGLMATVAEDPTSQFSIHQSATFARPLVNAFVMAGDSITAAAGPHEGRTFWAHADSYLGGRLNVIFNAGIGGNTSTQLLARFDADVIAKGSDWVHILIGENDPIDTVDGGYTPFVTNVTAMLDKCSAAGKKVVIGTITPRASGIFTTNQDNARKRMNAWIGELPYTRPVLVVDYSAALTDPATGYAVAGLLYDGSTHPGYGGCALMGRALAAVLDSRLLTQGLLLDNEADPAQLLLHGRFSAGGVGSEPTDWFETGASGAARTYSKVPRTDAINGKWQRIIVPAGGVVQLAQNVDVGPAMPVGGTVQFAVEYQASALEVATAGQYLFASVAAYNGAGFTVENVDLSPGTGAENVIGFDRSGVFLTNPLVIPAGTTLIQARIQMGGGGTYDFDRASVRTL